MCDAVAFLAQSLSSRVRAFVFACVSAWCVCACAFVLMCAHLKSCPAKACSGSVVVVFVCACVSDRNELALNRLGTRAQRSMRRIAVRPWPLACHIQRRTAARISADVRDRSPAGVYDDADSRVHLRLWRRDSRTARFHSPAEDQRLGRAAGVGSRSSRRALFEPRACVVYSQFCLYLDTCGFPCGFNVGSRGFIEAGAMRASCLCSIFAILFVSGHVWFPMWLQCGFPGNSATGASAPSRNACCSWSGLWHIAPG